MLSAAVAALAALPAAAAGLACAAPLAPVPLPARSYAAVAVIAGIAIGLPALLAGRAAGGGARGPRRRLVVESLAVVAAIGATLLFRQRGPQAGTHGTDPLMAAVPALLALAAGLLTLRALPYLLGPACRAPAHGRSAVAFIGLAGAARRRAAEPLPLVILLLALAVIGFTTTTRAGIVRAQRLATWQSVGGDARVDAQVLDPATIERERRVPGVRAAVPAEIHDGAHLSARTGTAEVTIVAIDLRAYRRMMAGTPVRPPAVPDRSGQAVRAGSPATVPALFSPAAAAAAGLPGLPGKAGGAGAGGLALTTDSGLQLGLRDAGTLARFPAQPENAASVVVPYDPVFRSTGGQVGGSVFVRGEHIDPDALRRADANPVYGAAGVAAAGCPCGRCGAST